MRFHRALTLVAAVLLAVLAPAGMAQTASADPLIPNPNQAKCILENPDKVFQCLHL